MVYWKDERDDAGQEFFYVDVEKQTIVRCQRIEKDIVSTGGVIYAIRMDNNAELEISNMECVFEEAELKEAQQYLIYRMKILKGAE